MSLDEQEPPIGGKTDPGSAYADIFKFSVLLTEVVGVRKIQKSQKIVYRSEYLAYRILSMSDEFTY
jgi:hypothetical protein